MGRYTTITDDDWGVLDGLNQVTHPCWRPQSPCVIVPVFPGWSACLSAHRSQLGAVSGPIGFCFRFISRQCWPTPIFHTSSDRKRSSRTYPVRVGTDSTLILFLLAFLVNLLTRPDNMPDRRLSGCDVVSAWVWGWTVGFVGGHSMTLKRMMSLGWPTWRHALLHAARTKPLPDRVTA